MTNITLGIDEVGRGPLAGPVVIAAVVLGSVIPDGLNDSKKLSVKKRAYLAAEIKKTASDIGVGWVSAAEIDRIGISKALKLATAKAVSQIRAPYDQIIIDGQVNFLPENPKVITMIKADGRIKSVSAASIIAKVARDEYMKQLATIFPQYGFERHAGYGTAAHLAAIRQNGASPVHRFSFAPLSAKKQTNKIDKTIGRRAENIAADFLRAKGHEIIEQNWKTPFCEIDIISQKDQQLHFTEVKYRVNATSGDGLSAITSQKLARLRKSVDIYQKLNPHNLQPVISVISMSQTPPQVEDYLDISR